MTKVKPLGKEQVKAALVESSIGLFADRGIKNVSIRDIAARANVNSALISRHFGGKQGLIEAVMRALLDKFGSAVEDKMTAGEDRLNSAVQAFISSPEITRVLAHIALEDGRSVLTEMVSPYLKDTIEQIQRDQKDARLTSDFDAQVLLGSGFAFGLGWVLFAPLIAEMVGMTTPDRDRYIEQIEKLWNNAITR